MAGKGTATTGRTGAATVLGLQTPRPFAELYGALHEVAEFPGEPSWQVGQRGTSPSAECPFGLLWGYAGPFPASQSLRPGAEIPWGADSPPPLPTDAGGGGGAAEGGTGDAGTSEIAGAPGSQA